MRRGRDPLGKLTAEVPKLLVDEETYSVHVQRAHALGLDFAVYHRKLLQITAHGKSRLLTMHEKQLTELERFVTKPGRL